MISLTVNGKRRELEEPMSLASFLTMLQLDARFIAVGHNVVVVNRDHYPLVTLQEGDTLEIVHMVGGG